MKSLFFSLCLVNVVFLFWEFRLGAFTPATKSEATHLPAILLVDEVQRAERGRLISGILDSNLPKLTDLALPRVVKRSVVVPKAVTPINSLNTPKSPLACYEVGPFFDQQAAAAWLAASKQGGDIVAKDTAVLASFVVYYPMAKDAEQNRINKMMLNAKGISDLWVIPNGELKGALSLGVFNNRQRADILKEQLAKRGVQAEIKERVKSSPRFYVKFNSNDSKLLNLTAGLNANRCDVINKRQVE